MAEQEGAKLWSELERHVSNENYDAALNTATKLKKLSPGDEDLHLVQLYCLIHLNQFDAALKLLDECPEHENATLLQRAYCHYRLHALDEALAALARGGQDDAGHVTLEAQIHYRREDYAKAIQLYSQLEWEDSAELCTNLSASYACAKAAKAAITGAMPQFAGVEATHELHFNQGCYALATGDFATAEDQLQSARDKCRETLREDGYDDADIDEELGVIQAQLGLVYQLTGRPAQAKEAFDSILKTKPSDVALTAVVSNNLVALMGEKNIFECKQKMKATSGHGLEQKLAKFQKGVIAGNQALLHFYDKQPQQCETALKAVIEADANSPLPALIAAAASAKNKQIDEALVALKGFVAQHPGASADRVLLTIGQLCLAKKDWEAAIQALSSDKELRCRPGVVSTLVALHDQLAAAEPQTATSHRDAAARLLRDAIAHAESAGKAAELAELLGGQAEFYTTHAMFADAADTYIKLLKHDPGNKRALAGLVTAYSYSDLQKAEQYAQQLPEITGSLPVSLETLEAVIPGKRTTIKKADIVQAATEEAKKPRKKRKGRKGKLPKDKDALIDPERWLPKWQRSYNRRKYKKQAQAQALRGPQGAAAASAPSQTGSLGGLKGKAPAAAAAGPVASSEEAPAAQQAQAKKTAPSKKKKKSKF